jgi:hypothetical protein
MPPPLAVPLTTKPCPAATRGRLGYAPKTSAVRRHPDLPILDRRVSGAGADIGSNRLPAAGSRRSPRLERGGASHLVAQKLSERFGKQFYVAIRLASFSRFTTFRVPVAAIAPLVSDLGAAIARRIPAGNGALKLLVSYLASALDTEALVTPELQQLAVTHVHDLLALALGATRDAAQASTAQVASPACALTVPRHTPAISPARIVRSPRRTPRIIPPPAIGIDGLRVMTPAATVATDSSWRARCCVTNALAARSRAARTPRPATDCSAPN